MKASKALFVVLASSVFGMAIATSAYAKDSPRVGATGQFVKNGVPTSPPIALPDCRGCKVTQNGPNHYTIQIPNSTRAKLGMPPAKNQ